MAIKKGTIKEKDRSTGVISDLYPKTSIDQVDNLQASLNAKQATLVSGTTIKTINGGSILGSGNLDMQPQIVFHVLEEGD